MLLEICAVDCVLKGAVKVQLQRCQFNRKASTSSRGHCTLHRSHVAIVRTVIEIQFQLVHVLITFRSSSVDPDKPEALLKSSLICLAALRDQYYCVNLESAHSSGRTLS